MMFLDCPAYLDERGAARCGLPAEVEYRYGAQSTDGVLESAKIRCPLGHWFSGTIEALTWDKGPRRQFPYQVGGFAPKRIGHALLSRNSTNPAFGVRDGRA